MTEVSHELAIIDNYQNLCKKKNFFFHVYFFYRSIKLIVDHVFKLMIAYHVVVQYFNTTLIQNYTGIPIFHYLYSLIDIRQYNKILHTIKPSSNRSTEISIILQAYFNVIKFNGFAIWIQSLL